MKKEIRILQDINPSYTEMKRKIDDMIERVFDKEVHPETIKKMVDMYNIKQNDIDKKNLSYYLYLAKIYTTDMEVTDEVKDIIVRAISSEAYHREMLMYI